VAIFVDFHIAPILPYTVKLSSDQVAGAANTAVGAM
jgi:hypothetical protein